MITEWGDFPEFSAEELNKLISLARTKAHYAGARKYLMEVESGKREIVSEKQLKFFFALKNELKEMVEEEN